MQTIASSHFLQDASSERLFSESFEKKPFLFSHNLHLHELFTIPSLKKLAAKLAKETQPRGYFWLTEDTLSAPKWGTAEFQSELAKAFDNIGTTTMRLKLSSIQSEPEYRPVLHECTAELAHLTGVDLTSLYRPPLETVFITSPGERTPYHVDSEANFLLQIYGTKTVYIFDGNDRELVKWRELEEYWHGSRTIALRDEFRSRATAFELRPGIGVHNPIHFPHWVQNGPSPSISLSLGYPPVKDPVEVLRVNRYLRRLGINPKPPGESAGLDMAKRTLLQTARSMKKALARG